MFEHLSGEDINLGNKYAKMMIAGVAGLLLVLAAPDAANFVCNYQLPTWLLLLFFGFWMVAFLLDVTVMVSCREMVRYERNIIFRFLVGKFGICRAVALQAMAEAGLVFATGYVFSSKVDLESMGIVSSVFGLAHMMAWYHNKKFLARQQVT